MATSLLICVFYDNMVVLSKNCSLYCFMNSMFNVKPNCQEILIYSYNISDEKQIA